VSHGWEGGKEGGGGGGEGGGRVGVPGYCGYYLSDHVRQSARTTGARLPISWPYNSKVAPKYKYLQPRKWPNFLILA
jgi:hypothetical protein